MNATSNQSKIVIEAGVRLRLAANHDSPTGHARPADGADNSVDDAGGAFFNPLMRCNRAFVFSALAALTETRDPAAGPLDCLDGFSASGAMALQWKTRLKSRVRVLAVDRCPAAMSALEANCELNGVSWRRVRPHEIVEQFNADSCDPGKLRILTALEQVNAVTETCPFDFVHLDPFGSPAGNVESALRHLRNGGLLSVTCTDLASLLGQQPQVAMRNYGATLMRVRCAPELGARALLAFVATCAARCNKAVRPVYCLNGQRFLLVCVRVDRGAKRADDCLTRFVGRLAHCRVCQQQRALPGRILDAGVGDSGLIGCGCGDGNDGGSAVAVLGPVWLGDLFEADLVQRMSRHLLSSCDQSVDGSSSELPGSLLLAEEKILLKMLLDEAQCRMPIVESENAEKSPAAAQPMFYISPKWLKLSGVDLPRLDQLIKILRSHGFAASRTHFDLTAVRTNATVRDCRDLIVRHTTSTAKITAPDSSMNSASSG